MRVGAPDLWTGLALMALAGAYYTSALTIPDSLLSDEVGASGLPKGLAVALGLSGALLALRSSAASTIHVKLAVKPQALGLLAIMAAYIIVLPLAGYPLALAALVAGVALLAGAKLDLTFALTAAGAGLGFWLIFAHLLGIAMPVGDLGGWY